MNIEKFEDAIQNCRFCFMCRHLSAIGNVRFTETDTPRVRAAMIYGLRTGTNKLEDEDFVETLYRQDLSACCRYHCVNHFDENGLAIAMRQDVVEAGKEPEKVRKLAMKLCNNVEVKASGKGKVALLLDAATAKDKAEVAALAKLMKAAAGDYVTVFCDEIGKTLKVLGYVANAKEIAANFAEAINKEDIKELVVPNPALYDALVNDYPEWGITLNATVFCTSGYLVAKKVKFSKKAGELYYLADDFMRNYCGCKCPENLLEKIGAVNKPFGTNPEETYNCGEGAMVLDKLEPELVQKLAQYVAARADNPKKDKIVTLGVYAKTQLVKHGKLKVSTLNEVAASCL